MQSYMAAACPKSSVLTVEASPAVLAAAKHFFGFNGSARVQDAHQALHELRFASSGAQQFDAIVVDITDTVLEKEDVENLHALLKDGGVVFHNHTNWQKMTQQLDTFQKIFPDAQQQQFFSGGNVLMLLRLHPWKQGKHITRLLEVHQLCAPL
eukprot:symbB.v1.2.017261.t1/scaffold1346.1/size178581/14